MWSHLELATMGAALLFTGTGHRHLRGKGSCRCHATKLKCFLERWHVYACSNVAGLCQQRLLLSSGACEVTYYNAGLNKAYLYPTLVPVTPGLQAWVFL